MFCNVNGFSKYLTLNILKIIQNVFVLSALINNTGTKFELSILSISTVMMLNKQNDG